MVNRHLDRLRYHTHDDDPAGSGPRRPAASLRGGGDGEQGTEPPFSSAESAARFYLSELLEQEPQRPGFRSALAPERPERVPGLQLRGEQVLGAVGTTVVTFDQVHADLPVFGGEALVELDDRRRLIAVDARLGSVGTRSGQPHLAVEDAVEAVATATGTPLDASQWPRADLVHFQDEDAAWHLAWLLKAVPAVLPDARPPGGRPGHGLDRSPRDLHPRVDYLVDADDGEVLYYYSVAPTATVALPTQLSGTDEDGRVQPDIWGERLGEAFALQDRVRNIWTYDLAMADLDGAVLPGTTVSAQTRTYGDDRRAAVSAHANATKVHDFYNSVLHRDGIDDKGMRLESVINVVYSGHGPGPEWRNAVWWDNRMWYGQVQDRGGRLVSLARHLDVIGHELTHGVIDASSALVYRDQSGALNESFADVFGVLIRNWWDAPDRDDVQTWSWTVGEGLGAGGGPLRDLSDPSRSGDPAHMDDLVRTSEDYGGVHTNSGIPNKAAHLLLTSSADVGPVLAVKDWTVVLYFTLLRLPRLADFADVPAGMGAVLKTYLAGDDRRLQLALEAVHSAYDTVGVK